MFSFLKAIANRRTADAQAGKTRYETLRRRALFRDDLSDAEAVEFDELHRLHGDASDLDKIAADFAEHKLALETIATAAKTQKELARSQKDVESFDLETQRIIADAERVLADRKKSRSDLASALAAA